jgi:hypothetical protein
MMYIPDMKSAGTFPIRGIIVPHDRLSQTVNIVSKEYARSISQE